MTPTVPAAKPRIDLTIEPRIEGHAWGIPFVSSLALATVESLETIATLLNYPCKSTINLTLHFSPAGVNLLKGKGKLARRTLFFYPGE